MPAVATPVGSVVVSRYFELLVKQSTAKVISTMVMLVSAVRNFRRRMFDSAAAAFWDYNDFWPVTRGWAIVDPHWNA